MMADIFADLPEALAMVQRAVASNPKSGAMIDSLGWAYFRLGDYKKAVEKLEEAIELEAGDPDINNHLGATTRILCSGMPSTKAHISSRSTCGFWLLTYSV